MTSALRFSTPIYLDPSKGQHCGSCSHCDIDNPFNPARYGMCLEHDACVKITTPTNCKQYAPKQQSHLLNLEQ